MIVGEGEHVETHFLEGVEDVGLGRMQVGRAPGERHFLGGHGGLEIGELDVGAVKILLGLCHSQRRHPPQVGVNQGLPDERDS